MMKKAKPLQGCVRTRERAAAIIAALHLYKFIFHKGFGVLPSSKLRIKSVVKHLSLKSTSNIDVVLMLGGGMVGREIVSQMEGMKKFSVELEILPFRDLNIFKHGSLKFVTVEYIPL